jgi:hypothetical protein
MRIYILSCAIKVIILHFDERSIFQYYDHGLIKPIRKILRRYYFDLYIFKNKS